MLAANVQAAACVTPMPAFFASRCMCVTASVSPPFRCVGVQVHTEFQKAFALSVVMEKMLRGCKHAVLDLSYSARQVDASENESPRSVE